MNQPQTRNSDASGGNAEARRRRGSATHPLQWSGVLAEQGYVLGVDISGSGERVVLSNLQGDVISRDVAIRLDDAPQQPQEIVTRVIRMINSLTEAAGVKPREVLRIGVGFGGPVDAQRGLVRMSHDNPGWRDYPLASGIESVFDVPTLLDNDARLAALGEMWFGAGRGDFNCSLVYIHWSTGVGGGIVSDGKLTRGATTMAGEIGHTTVRTREPDLLPCRCGGKGHLEAYLRAASLLERASALGSATPNMAISSISELAKRAEDDDRIRGLLDEAVDMMAITVGNLTTALNPDLVVIGGRVAREIPQYIPRIAELARAYTMPLTAESVDIVPAVLAEDSVVMGAVALGLDSLR